MSDKILKLSQAQTLYQDLRERIDALPTDSDIPEVPVQDVQINGTSILSDGIANVPIASDLNPGVVKVNGNGVAMTTGGIIQIIPAPSIYIKAGTEQYTPIAPKRQHEATFYGLAKAAGDTTQSVSTNAVGTYTADAKAAIQTMLGVPATSALDSYALKTNTVLETTLSMGRKTNTTVGQFSTALGIQPTASGQASIALGIQTTASGVASYAAGISTTASNQASYAEGISTVASGSGAHTEGGTTTASGAYSHAEGENTTASGNTSHAEGWNTIANHYCQHVFGQANVADISNAAASARGTYVEIIGNGVTVNSRSNAYALDWNGNGHFAGDVYVGCNADSTGGTKLVTIDDITNNKLIATFTHPVDSNTGEPTTEQAVECDRTLEEILEAYNSGKTVIGIYSSPMGTGAKIDIPLNINIMDLKSNGVIIAQRITFSGLYLGLMNITVVQPTGSSTLWEIMMTAALVANMADASDTISYNANAKKIINIANPTNTQDAANKGYVDSAVQAIPVEAGTGLGSVKTKNFSDTSLTYSISASGKGAFASGGNTSASGAFSHAEGLNTQATGYGAHAEGGSASEASGQFSHAEGWGTTASKTGAHSEGQTTIASGNYSHAEGKNTTASGSNAHAEGYGNTASGNAAHVEGRSNTSSGQNTHVEGQSSIGTGMNSHIEGFGSIGHGNNIHIEGMYNVEDVPYSNWVSNTEYHIGDKIIYAENNIPYICIADNSDEEFDTNKWENIVNTSDYAHIVGNGDLNTRSNAYALDWNGNGHYMGDIYVGANADSSGGTRVATVIELAAKLDAAEAGLKVVRLI